MYKTLAFQLPTQKIMAGLIVLMSLLMVAYSPMVSISAAQSASELQGLKKKAMDELNRRIASYEKTLKSLGVTVKATGGEAPSISVTAKTPTELPTGLKDNVAQFIQKIVDGLKQMKQKVEDTTSLANMKSLGQNIDSQFKINQVANAQAAVTKSIESASGVLDKLKTTFGNVQGQVTKLKDCVQNGATGNGCDLLKVDSSAASSAQSQLDSLSTIMTTITSIIGSAIVLLVSLVSSFGGIAGGLGGLGNLGNLGNLSNLTNLGGLTGSLGSLTGLLGSFSAITSQLDITSMMSSGAFTDLSSLTSLINL